MHYKRRGGERTRRIRRSREFGPRGGDELNLIEAGKNYGWILVTHGAHYNGDAVARGAEGVPGMTDPVLFWVPSTNRGNISEAQDP